MRDPRNWVAPGRRRRGRHRRRRRARGAARPRARPSAARPDRRAAGPAAERAAARRRPRGAQAARQAPQLAADPPAAVPREVPCVWHRCQPDAAPPRTDLGPLADEDLMQLVERGDAPAFELIYDRHAGGRLLARLPHVRHAQPRRGRRRRRRSSSIWRSGARYDRARGSVRTWVLGHRAPPRDRRAAPQHGPRPPARERRGHRGALRGAASAPTSRPPGARRRARSAPRSTTLPAEQGRVIELAYFGGFTHTEIAEMLGDADRHREGPDAARAGEAARRSDSEVQGVTT